MALEYPLYVHLAPGQKFGTNLSKLGILAQRPMREEVAPKKEIAEFKAALSRITLEMDTCVLTVAVKGKRSAAR